MAPSLLLALAFGLAYCQAPLYYSNQNQYFLHGLADAGVPFLQKDWLANTADPTPVFSFLVRITCGYLHEYAFYGYYLLLFGVYSVSMVGLFSYLAGERDSWPRRLVFFALFLLIHSALARWGSYRLFGWDYPWYFQSGLAGQYLLGAMFQPSSFGVLLILSIYLFVRDRPFWAVASAVVAATCHSTYLLVAGMLTLAFMVVLWHKGDRKQALRLGAWALLLVAPGVIYALVVFRPSSSATFAEAQRWLVYERIPHHCLPRLWCDGIAVVQVAWMLLALFLVRRTPLFAIMGIPFVLSAALTLLQVATGSDTLALLFPWRTSAVLMPLATTVILARLILTGPRWLDRPAVAIAPGLLVLGLVIAGLALTWFRQGYQVNDNELGLLRHVKANRTSTDVYLLPVQKPNLIATTFGSQSSDFKPLAAKKTDARVIPVDLQRFRLSTGAPIFVDFKAVPYKDSEVREWHDRLELNPKLHEQIRAGQLDDVRHHLQRYGITHIVVLATQPVEGSGLKKEYEDEAYCLYRIVP